MDFLPSVLGKKHTAKMFCNQVNVERAICWALSFSTEKGNGVFYIDELSCVNSSFYFLLLEPEGYYWGGVEGGALLYLSA